MDLGTLLSNKSPFVRDAEIVISPAMGEGFAHL